MGKKKATNELINRLLLLLDNTNDSVRSSVCQALGEIGGKAAANEVINRLLLLLDDTNDSVSHSACETLGKMGEKAGTNEVINRLLFLLADTKDSIRRTACEALKKCSGAAGINKVSAISLDVHWHDDFGMKDIVDERTGKCFGSFPCMPNLEEDIDKVENALHYCNCWFRKNSFAEASIRLFLHTKLSFWLPFITRHSIENGYGISVTENTLVVYGSKEPVELPFSDGELGKRLQHYWFNWLDKSLER
jgi:hypothetical protein